MTKRRVRRCASCKRVLAARHRRYCPKCRRRVTAAMRQADALTGRGQHEPQP